MYIPAHFVNNNRQEIIEFIRANSFGIIISASGEIRATHIPLELSEDGQTLSGHFSKANPQANSLRDGDVVLCIFNGPHAYISSSWYNHENVPTWNYVAVHVKGNIRLIEGEALYRRLTEIVDKYEAASEHPVSVERMTPEYVSKHIKGIVGFEVEITSIEAAYKLSQNRDRINHQTIVQELDRRGDYHSGAIAEEMKKRTPKA
jgi:transcriptional regulator